MHYGENSKTFNEKDYEDAKTAFRKAVLYRNKLIEADTNLPSKKTIYGVLMESYNLLPVRQKTIKNHQSLFNSFIKDINLRDFDEAFAYRTLNSMIETSPNDTITRVFSLLERIDKTCLIQKYYSSSVMFSVICPKSHLNENTIEKEPITKEDLEKLKQGCSRMNEYDRISFPLILDFIYMTGCRPCEVWPLTWDDITDHISINKELGSSNIDLDVIRQPKTPLSNRKLPITPKMETLLKQARNLSKGKLVFPDRYGRMQNTDNVGRRLNKIAKKEGIEFHLYDLRHRFATDLTMDGVDDRTKMELMGHKNIKTTLGYARSNEKAKKEALKDR